MVCAARTVEKDAGEFPGTIHETVDAIRAAGGKAIAIRCDIGVPADIDALVAGTVEEFGRLDVLVNNAMTPTNAPLDDVDGRHVGRLDPRQRAEPVPVHAGGDAA